MSKQTRLNFSKASSAPSKKRKLNPSDDTNEKDDYSLRRSEATESSKSKLGSIKSDTSSSPEKANTSPWTRPNPSSATSSSKSNTTITESSSSKMSDPEIPQGAPPKISSNLKPLNLSTSSTSPPKSPSNIDDDNTSETTTHHLRITSHRASLFASPPHTLLCHATNAQGTWGAGIALAFKKSYPRAFTLYATHCKNFPPSTLLGTTLIIPPQLSSPSKAEREAQHWIGCLFTSEKKGKGKGSKESILEATGEAIRNLVRQLEEAKEEEAIKEVRMCKINSGLFGVPWEATKRVIEGVEVEEGGLREVGVYSLD